ncbi:MAG: acyl-CoA dehydrogenase family protein, partial [Sphingomonadaceae bacterium]|nr:acyl-CoA dehydrogenase family protein [Sphingomonadaceae bacterium]
QNTQFKLAECKTHATIARSFFDSLMVRMLADDLDATTAAMAKWWTTDTQGKVLDECLQLHGGYGYMVEYPIARLWRDARVLKIWAGTNEIMKVIIARSL